MIKIFILIFFISSFLFSKELTSSEFKILQLKLTTGDIIYINSDEYFSRMFKDFTKCKASTMGLIVKNLYGDIMILKSDIDEMRGKGGIRYVSLESYLNSYSDEIEYKIYRPKDIEKLDIKRLQKMIDSSRDLSIPYDLSFSYKNDKALTCVEMVSKLYKDNYMFNPDIRNSRFYKVDYPCDILENNFNIIIDWTKYKPRKGCS